MKKPLIIACVASVFLVGCANTVRAPRVADLNDSDVIINQVYVGDKSYKIKSLSIVDKTTVIKQQSSMFIDMPNGYSYSPNPKDLLAGDLKRFFNKNTTIDQSSDVELVISIKKMNAYWIWNSANNVPLFGIFSIGRDTPHRVEIEINIEIQKDSKVIKTYGFGDTIEIMGSVLTRDDIDANYKKLILAYRSKLINQLKDDFLVRYL